MKLNDSFDNILFNYFKNNKINSKEIEDSILKLDLGIKPKAKNNIINMWSIKKVSIALLSLLAITTGVVFANDIYKSIINIFNDSQGVLTALENGYVYNVNSDFSESSNTKIRVEDMLMDNNKLDLNFLSQFDSNLDLKDFVSFRIDDLLIVNENNQVLCSADVENSTKYLENNGIQKSEISDKFINTSFSVFPKNRIDEHTFIFTLNCAAASGETLPKSEKLYISFSSLTFKNEYGTKNHTLTGNWSFEIDVPEQFKESKELIYNVVDCNNKNVHANSITVRITETGMKFDMTMYWGDYEYWMHKSEEIRQKNALSSSLISQEKSYVENEKGKKFYPAQISSDDGGYSFTTDGNLHVWETFNLTKFDATNTLKLVLTTIDNEKIIINFKI